MLIYVRGDFMINHYSKEEKDAVIEFCIECLNDRLTTSDGSMWYFFDTDDVYMRLELKQSILEMDTSKFLRPAKIVEFDGNKNLNDDFKFHMIRQAVIRGDIVLLFTNLLDYEKWYIANHPDNKLKHPLISGTFNWLRDGLFNEYGARIIFLLSQEENNIFQLWGLDFYSQNNFDKNLDYLLKVRKDWFIFTESEKKQMGINTGLSI